jgi:hypothetical protein
LSGYDRAPLKVLGQGDNPDPGCSTRGWCRESTE